MLEIFAGTRTDCAIDGFRVYFDSDDGVFFWIIAFLVISDDNHHVVVDVSVIALHVTETEARDVVFFWGGQSIITDEGCRGRYAVDHPVRYVVVLDDFNRPFNRSLVHDSVADAETRLIFEKGEMVVRLPEAVSINDLCQTEMDRLGVGGVGTDEG